MDLNQVETECNRSFDSDQVQRSGIECVVTAQARQARRAAPSSQLIRDPQPAMQTRARERNGSAPALTTPLCDLRNKIIQYKAIKLLLRELLSYTSLPQMIGKDVDWLITVANAM